MKIKDKHNTSSVKNHHHVRLMLGTYITLQLENIFGKDGKLGLPDIR
jgi:hypothetical protein